MSTLSQICALPRQWHASGSMYPAVLAYIENCAAGAEWTAETGCGKSTLLLSNVSKNHLVFAVAAYPDEDAATHSLNLVQSSPLFNANNTKFVLGPTQKTLPRYQFHESFELVILDGPHGFPFPNLEYFYFYPHIKPGGWLVVDDVQIRTIAQMVDVLKADVMWSHQRTIKTTAFFRRTEAPIFPPTNDFWWEQRFNRLPALRHVPLAEWPRLLLPQSLKNRLKHLLNRVPQCNQSW